MTEENKDHLSISCLVDYLKYQKDVPLGQAAESLSSYWGLSAEPNPTVPSTERKRNC